MKTNAAVSAASRPRTHEGAPGEEPRDPFKALRRAVATCLLFEDTYYEKGSSIAARIADCCAQVSPSDILLLAVEARNEMKLRHVPLFLMVQAANRAKQIGAKGVWGEILPKVIRRPDELAELLSLYWKDQHAGPLYGITWKGKHRPISAQLRKGLALSFRNFGEYQLAKWNRDREIKLRDVLRLAHPKPETPERSDLWKRLNSGDLATPDTWEVALSAAKTKEEKKTVWTRLLESTVTLPNGRVVDLLGDMAFIMNVRNMSEAGVARGLIATEFLSRTFSKMLPFRFIAAANAVPGLAQEISDAMLRALSGMKTLGGETHIVVDVSGSMEAELSSRGTLTRLDAAAALAVLIRETGSCRVFTFSDGHREVKNLRGLPLRDAIWNSQPQGGTYLGEALTHHARHFPVLDRIIVITDEQTHDQIVPAKVPAYIVNVAPYKVGQITTGNGWTRVDGFSERIVDWICFEETGKVPSQRED